MRILYLAPRFPYPPQRGDAVRAWSHIAHLAARHEVWLAATDLVAPAPEALARVRAVCAEVCVETRRHAASLARGAAGLLAGHSLTEGYFHQPALARTIDAWSRRVRFDAVIAFSSAMAPYARGVLAPRRVLDMNDVDSRKWRAYASAAWGPRRAALRLETRRVEALERRSAGEFDLTLLVNERERRRLTDATGSTRSAVLRTAVPLAPPEACAPVPATRDVGMLGSMFYRPNVEAVEWFGRHVWPRIAARFADARWWIIGADPTPAVRRWGRQPNVIVTGRVEDPVASLRSLRVFANAVAGSLGVQTKLLTAMAARKACVVRRDAAEGIDFDGPPPFLVAEEPAEFADAVCRVLADETLTARLAGAAAATIERYYAPESELRRLEAWLESAPHAEVSPAAQVVAAPRGGRGAAPALAGAGT